MTAIKPSDHGIVVQHKESGVRYALSDENYDPKTERKVRDLKPGETTRSYIPKPAPEGWEPSEEAEGSTNTPESPAKSTSDASEPVSRTATPTTTPSKTDK